MAGASPSDHEYGTGQGPVSGNAPDPDRLRRREAGHQTRFKAALEGLRAVTSPVARAAAVTESDPLAYALAVIAADYGAAGSGTAADPELPLARRLPELVAGHGLYYRRIDLNGDWARQALFALLAFDRDGIPLALLPAGPDRYRMVAHGRPPQDLDPATAAALEPMAYQIYPSLDSDGFTPRALLGMTLWRRGREGWVLPVVLLLAGLLSLLNPVASGYLVDTVIPFNERSQLPLLGAVLFMGAAGVSLFRLTAAQVALRLEGSFDARCQPALWGHLLHLPVSFFRRYSTGEINVRTQGIDAIRRNLSNSVVGGLSMLAIAISSLGLMLYYDFRLALVLLALLALLGGLNIFLGKRLIDATGESLRRQGEVQSSTLQLLGGLAKIRVAGAEKAAFARWTPRYAALMQTDLRIARLRSLGTILDALLPYLVLFVIVLVVGLQSHELLAVFRTPRDWQDIEATDLRQMMPPAVFIAFFVAATQFAVAFKGLTEAWLQVVAVKPYFEATAEVMAATPESAGAGEEPGELSGAVEVRSVDFRYEPDAPRALRGLSLNARPGQFVAVVGPSGAGKSSLVRLLLGFESPERGSIYYDGKDLSRLDKRLVRRQFGVVLQDSRLLPGTLYQNIVAGTGLPLDDAWEAARMAGLEDDIRAMPMQMHTVIGEGGGTLSGGQRQRLIIARALVRRPRFILFDEATSALDNRTQAMVSDSLARLGCTRIVIAHRLSTIRHADMIYVLDAGQVVESGDFEALLERGGLFAQLARRQM